VKIKKVIIHNFRSIKHCEVECRNILVLLGQNNHGKSNILRAIEFALTSSEKPTIKDLFAFHDEEDDSIWVELIFDQLTEQEQITFKKYISSSEEFCFRKTAAFDDHDKPNISYNGYTEEPEEEWLKAANAGNYTSRASVNEIPLNTYVPETGRLSRGIIEEAQQQYIEDHRDELTLNVGLEDSPLLGQKNVAAGVLPDFYLVPAVRDLSEESKVKNTAFFGKLLSRAVADMTANDPRFQTVQEQLEKLISILNVGVEEGERPQQLKNLESSLEAELSDWGVKVDIEVNPPDIDKIFELGTDIHLDDGYRTLAKHKGHGLQRAVIFGLMKAWAKALRTVETEELESRKASESIIFAVEEPELFLHPHAQRALAKALYDLGDVDNNQVFICSHSTHFVDLDHYRDIAIAQKSENETTVLQCNRELFEGEEVADRKHRFHMASWINPDRGEMLFAKKIVFVEGETETSILPFLAQKLGCCTDDISIVDCGSKHNLPLYIEIANAFGLNYCVIHDEDPLPDPIPTEWDTDKVRSKRNTFALNATIAGMVSDSSIVHMLSPDFEGCAGVSRTQGKRMGKALATLDFFEGKTVGEIPECIQSFVRNIYSLA